MKLYQIFNYVSMILWSASVALAANFNVGDTLTATATEATDQDHSTVYDYIVVGSGPGGGPLAARLAIAGFKVLLIDAGSDQGNTPYEEVPSLWPLSAQYAPMQWSYFVNHYSNTTRAESDTKFTWKTPAGDYYVGANQPTGSTPLGILYPRAGTLGGCAAHNALITIYPHDSDWDNIVELTGDQSWAPSKMRKYFQKLERNGYLSGRALSGHGTKGWLGTSELDPSVLVQDSKMTCHVAAVSAMMNNQTVGPAPATVSELNNIMNKDPNGIEQSDVPGLYQLPLAASNGTRSSPRDFIVATANAVNRDGSRKYHLDVRLNTFVTKITFDQTANPPRAIGVDYISGPGLYSATLKSAAGSQTRSGCFEASREVVVSAGAYNTPQLLKLSGIGSKAELESFGIPVLVDLPGVGTNLQDRYENAIVSKTSSIFEILDGCSLLTTNPDPCLQKWQNGTTPAQKGFYASNAFPISAIFKSSVAASDPDVFIFGGPVNFRGFVPGWADPSTLVPASAKGWWTWVVLKAHGRNHAGTVTLRSTNPLDTPLISFNSFDTGTTTDCADQLDLQAAYEGVSFVRKVNSQLQCADGAFEEVWPGSNITSEADMKDIIKENSFGHHASCTAAIGADGDPNAVLDSSFRVRGVSGLRVVDASSFPKTPGFFPALPLYMISEKAADVIVQQSGH